MRIERMGEAAVRLFDLPAAPAVVAQACAKIHGVEDAVATADCVGVYFPPSFEISLLDNLDFAEGNVLGKVHNVPVCYDRGPDMSHVCDQLGITQTELIKLHTSEPWPCFAIGFCPGFAYLGPVWPELLGVPRLPSPRVRTQAGMVGLTRSQTAVYPLVRPGGWPLIGQTPLTLVNVEEGYFPISVGDFVQFTSISQIQFEELEGERL